MGRFFELDDDLTDLVLQFLAGTQVKRNTLPAPVVDEEARHGIGWCSGCWGYIGFAQVTAVLTDNSVPVHIRTCDGADGADDLDLFITGGVGVVGAGGFHGHQGEQLEQVILEHVTDDAGFVVITSAGAHANGLGDCDLHIIDVVAVPQGLEDGVGKARHQNVLHGFLTEVVINAINLVFVQHGVDALIERTGAGEVGAEGLFDDHAAPSAVLLQHAGSGKPINYFKKILRRSGQVVHAVGRTVLQRRKAGVDLMIGLRVGDVAGMVAEFIGKTAPQRFIYRCGRDKVQLLSGDTAQVIVRPWAASSTEHAKRRG